MANSAKAERRRRPRYRGWFIALAALLLLWFALGLPVAWLIVGPQPRTLDARGDLHGVPCEELMLHTPDGMDIAGWYAPQGNGRAVVFCAGISSNRTQGLSRAKLYLERGYSVLLLDLRGTGHSTATPVSFGWRERFDLLAAHAWLAEQGHTHIGAHGISLGAATVLFALQDDPGFAFTVLESPFDTLEHAWANRLAMVGVPAPVGWPVRFWTQLLIRERSATIAPIAYAPLAEAPVLLVAGDSEPELRVSETRAIYDALGAPEKALHLFAGGRHENFFGRYPEEYAQVFGQFLDRVEAAWAK